MHFFLYLRISLQPLFYLEIYYVTCKFGELHWCIFFIFSSTFWFYCVLNILSARSVLVSFMNLTLWLRIYLFSLGNHSMGIAESLFWCYWVECFMHKVNPISLFSHGFYLLLNSLVSYWAGDSEIYNCLKKNKFVCFSFELLNFCIMNFETLLLSAYILRIKVSSSWIFFCH